jgi:RNA polymerase sigma-70 factor (ECF subfamily)
METKVEQMNDEELTRLVLAGEKSAESAFTELYNRYSPRVYAYCRRFLGDRVDSEDAFQETFIKFHHCIKQNQPVTSLFGLIMKIARNLCLNAKRRTSPIVSYEDYMSFKNDNRTEQDELLNLIKTSIDLLPDDLREMFILREYDGLSYLEIAEVTDSPINTVKVKLFRAKKRLREILAPYLADYSDFDNNMSNNKF